MIRTEYILSKVRPIKKLFVIEPNDYDSFATSFLEIQDEIDIIQNLYFVNDIDLWSQPSKDFIKRADPDIIINLSKQDDEKLSMHFGILSVKPLSESFKISRFGTNLFIFTNKPDFLNKRGIQIDENIEILATSKLENTPESLFASINYGLFQKNTKKYLELSIFKKIKITYLSKLDKILNSLFDNDRKYIHLTNGIGSFAGTGHGTSIYEVDYNRERLFDDNKKYIFISDKNDFKTIAYFWNTRSYYSFSKIAWIPIDLIDNINALIDKNTVFVCFNSDLENKIKNNFPTTLIIRPSRLHFRGRNERWTFFEHTQTISITENEAIIQHPANKSFSDMGSLGVFVIEIRGLKELIFPKRRKIGNLFFPRYYDQTMFPERFQRISELGLSKYFLEVSPLKSEDFSEFIKLPTFNEVIQHLFEDIGYKIKTTPKSLILEQTVKLMGGLNELNLISSGPVFDLLVSLTPKVRTEKVVKKIIDDIGTMVTSDNILDIVAEIREKGAVSFPSVTLTIEEIINKTSLVGNEKKKLLPVLQKLYDHRIFLRGKYFDCPSCNSKLWIQIDGINRSNYCVECNNLVNLPVYQNDKQDSDYYRLNQLIVRAVDQGQLSTLLLLNTLLQQNYRAFDYLSNIEVFKNDNLITDIDLLIKIGKRIGFIECKSTNSISTRQVDELIIIATTFQCDFIGFSILVDSTNQEILDLFDLLSKKNLNIPAFIFTNEALFNPRDSMIPKYFELHGTNDFQTGPIIIK